MIIMPTRSTTSVTTSLPTREMTSTVHCLPAEATTFLTMLVLARDALSVRLGVQMRSRNRQSLSKHKPAYRDQWRTGARESVEPLIGVHSQKDVTSVV